MTVKIKGYKKALIYSQVAHQLFLWKLLDCCNNNSNNAITKSMGHLLGKPCRANSVDRELDAECFHLFEKLDKDKKLTYQECKVLYECLNNRELSLTTQMFGLTINVLDKWVDMLSFCATSRVTLFVD